MKTHRPPVPTPAGGCAPAERHNQPEEAARQVSISPEVLQAAAEAVRISYPNSLQAELQQVGAKPQGFIAKPAARSSSALCAGSCQHRPHLCSGAAGNSRGGAACRAATGDELRGAGGCVARVFWSGGGPLGRPRQRSHTRMRSLGSRYQNRPDF